MSERWTWKVLLCFSLQPFGKLERVQRNCIEVALVALVIQASAPLALAMGSCELALLLPQINAARNIDSTGKNSRWKHRTSLGLCTETRSFLHFMRFNQLWNDVLRVSPWWQRWKIRWPCKPKRVVTWTSEHFVNLRFDASDLEIAPHCTLHYNWKCKKCVRGIEVAAMPPLPRIISVRLEMFERFLNICCKAHVYRIFLCVMMVNWLGDQRWLLCCLGVSFLLKGNSLNVVVSLKPSCLQFCLDMSWHTVHHLVFNSLGISIDPDLVLKISCWSQELDISFWMLGHALYRRTILKALIWSDLMLADVCSSCSFVLNALAQRFAYLTLLVNDPALAQSRYAQWQSLEHIWGPSKKVVPAPEKLEMIDKHHVPPLNRNGEFMASKGVWCFRSEIRFNSDVCYVVHVFTFLYIALFGLQASKYELSAWASKDLWC